jgi:hypothetical protein
MKTILGAALILAGGGLISACGDGDPEPASNTSVNGDGDGEEPGGDEADAGGDGDGDSPAYAMMVQVHTPDSEDRTVYAVLTDTLDIDGVSLQNAREFGGIANFAAVGGRLLVSSGEQPRIDSFEITSNLDWQPHKSIGFLNYGLAEDGANVFYQWFVDDTTAYLPFDITSRVIWNPSTLRITDVVEDGSLSIEQDGLRLEVGGNRTGLRYRGPVMHAFFYHDENWETFSPTSPIAVYDPETHTEEKIIEAPCSGLAVATQDESGNTYFSSWDYSPGKALFGEAPAPCTARVTTNQELDEDWTTDFTDWTDGRFTINFRYIGSDKGLAEVLHHEDIDYDFSGVYDPTVEDEIWGGGHWRLWFFDLEQGIAQPVTGIAPGSEGYQLEQVDDRTFLFVHYDEGSTIAYELESDGSVTERFQASGEVFKWVRVR